jgi:rod shape-determining protein MreC
VTERQSRWLLVLVLAAQLVLLSSQVPGSNRDQSLLETLSLRAVAPFARVVSAGGRGLAGVRQSLRSRKQLQQENQELRGRLGFLEEERVRFFGLERRLERLDEAVLYEPPVSGPVRAADVVHVDYGSWYQTLILYAGKGGARRQQPVVTSEGLLGRVVVVAGPFAKVQLITDRAASVGAMVERTRRQGVARGGREGMLEMDFVPLQADVVVGDRIVTAGIDGIFPRGLPVGRVTAVAPGNELFHRIRVQPAVDFGRLDQVYLLEIEPVPEDLVETSDAEP